MELGARVEVGFSQDRQFFDRSLADEEGDGGDSDGGREEENRRAEGGIVIKTMGW